MKLEVGLAREDRLRIEALAAEANTRAEEIALEIRAAQTNAILIGFAVTLSLLLVARALVRLNLSEAPSLP